MGKEAKERYSRKVAEDFPDTIQVGDTLFVKALGMRYGYNPDYPAAFYKEEGASGPNMSTMQVLQQGTKGLGFINTEDADYASRIVKKVHDVLKGKVIASWMKHVNPSGVARADTVEEAVEQAYLGDPKSGFGGVVCVDAELTADTARFLRDPKKNVEVVFAPSYTESALEELAKRASIRVLRLASFDEPSVDNGLDYKRTAGGLLVTKRYDSRIVAAQNLRNVAVRQATEDETEAAIFNWLVAGYCRSNTVVLGKRYRTVGIGTGQQSRIDAAQLAVKKAIEHHGGAEGTVMASDAYIPFNDVLEVAYENGVTAIAFPLGSNNDGNLIAAANERDMALLATAYDPERPNDCERCFDHH